MVLVNYSKKSCQISFLCILSLLLQCLISIYKKLQIRRFRFGFIFFMIFTMCFLYITYDQRNKTEEQNMELFPQYIFYTNTSTYIPLDKVNQQSYRRVLLWTDLFSDFYWHQPLFFNLSTIVTCSSMYQCQFTRDKRKLSRSSLVAFHLYDLNRYKLPERISSNNNNQSWIFITGESPINFYYQNPSFSPYILDDYFDQSISYKYDSPFSIYSPIIKSRILSNHSLNLSSEQLNERQLNNNSLKHKKKAIAWIVSNCITFSQREKYVDELRKYINIDIYGKCGTLCSNRQCKIDLHEYYFYLSFENSRCHSYITEKFWHIISDNIHRLVPIVLGASEADYERIAPKQSYIHVNKYKTPEDLAKYLHYLINNPEEYLKYLQWREYTEITLIKSGSWTNLLCPLCQMAHETRLSSHIRMNFSSWFNPKTQCYHDDVHMLTQCKQVNLRDWMGWTHNMKCP